MNNRKSKGTQDTPDPSILEPKFWDLYFQTCHTLGNLFDNTGSPLNSTVYFGTLICPFSTKSLLRLHGRFSKVLKNSVSRGPPVFHFFQFFL